jgi:hypothetical protein
LVALFRAVSHCKRHRSAVPAPESHSSKTVQGVETPATIEFPARSCKFRPMPGRAGICGIPKRLALRGAPAPLTVAEPAAEYCTVSAIRGHRLFLCEHRFRYTSYYPTRWIRFVKMRPVQNSTPIVLMVLGAKMMRVTKQVSRISNFPAPTSSPSASSRR